MASHLPGSLLPCDLFRLLRDGRPWLRLWAACWWLRLPQAPVLICLSAGSGGSPFWHCPSSPRSWHCGQGISRGPHARATPVGTPSYRLAWGSRWGGSAQVMSVLVYAELSTWDAVCHHGRFCLHPSGRCLVAGGPWALWVVGAACPSPVSWYMGFGVLLGGWGTESGRQQVRPG